MDERFVIESVITEDEKRSWLHGAIDRMFNDKGFISDNQCLFIYRHEWEYIHPQAVSEDDIERQEYDYLFKDGEWFVRAQYDSKVGKNWKPLKKYFN